MTEEQLALRDAVRRLVAVGSPIDRARRDEGTVDRELHHRLAGLGVYGLGIPEECGGVGGGWVEIVLVAEELGYALAPVPYVATVGQTLPLLVWGGEDAVAARVAAGEHVITSAVGGARVAWPAATDIAATWSGGGWTLDGRCRFVEWAGDADAILVPACIPDGTGVFLVPTSALRTEPMRTADRIVRFDRVEFAAAPGARVGAESAADIIRRVGDLDALGRAALLVGIGRRALEDAVTYARTRVQFGRPIGSFQAIQHRCADASVGLEAARSAVLMAARAVDERASELPASVSMAKCLAGEAARAATATCIQVHGGLGFTWEHHAHLLFRRAWVESMLGGTPEAHRERFADLIGW